MANVSDAPDDDDREDPVHGTESESEVAGSHHAPPTPTHEDTPRDERSKEPLGPVTPDEGVDLGDTAEAHDEIIPRDLPKDHPGRKEAERIAAEGDGTVKGNV